MPQEKKNPNTGSRSGTIKLSRKPINGKGTIVHHTRNLDKKQIEWANHNSFDGNRGTLDAKSYEAYRKEIEFSGLSITQKRSCWISCINYMNRSYDMIHNIIQ